MKMYITVYTVKLQKPLFYVFPRYKTWKELSETPISQEVLEEYLNDGDFTIESIPNGIHFKHRYRRDELIYFSTVVTTEVED